MVNQGRELDTMEQRKEYYMRLALAEARKCSETGDVPVGCVIVQKDRVIATGRNRREERQDPLAHAELEALAVASQVLGRWRLEDCHLYVTLEPCAMCTGGIINSKINSLYYGAWEEKTGCCGSVVNLFMEGLGQGTKVYGGILEEECRGLLQEFFRKLR
ncbi:MAG: nucleoside deaminase [Eubacteriales bacterium]